MGTGEQRGIGFVTGLLLLGYGTLVLLGVLPHESFLVGIGLVAAGVGLLLTLRLWDPADHRSPAGRPRPGEEQDGASYERTLATVLLGTFAAGSVLSYNLATGGAWNGPKLAILGYGVLLLGAAPHLHRRLGPVRLGALVAWSLPLLGAPLGVWAFDAALDAGAGSSPLDAFIEHALVPPMETMLSLLGFEVTNHGQTLSMDTPRGELFLTVGLVCAGIQPGILFLGLLGLDAWKSHASPRRLGALFGLGVVAVYTVNMIRLVGLAIVGHRWGGDALQTVHAHGGWVLFVGLVLVFWGLVLPLVDSASDRIEESETRYELEA